MRWGSVEIVVKLLHIFAVVALIGGQAEQALLENRIAPVPQHQSEAELLLVVTDAGEAVLTPAIRAATCRVVR